MSEAAGELNAIAAQWRWARCLYPIYLGIAERFALALVPCPELNSLVDRAEPEAVAGLRRWLHQADELIQPYQLRFFLQTSPLSTEASLRALAEHLLHKQDSCTATDRDKLDFLLVQYFAQCAPLDLLEREPALEEVARVLEPVLGKVRVEVPEWLQPLEDMRRRLDGCATMSELLQNRILIQIRNLKNSAGEAGFTPPVLVVLARLNYLIRQTFFRIMRADVEAIHDAVRELRRHGITSIDGVRAQLSRSEPLSRVLELSADWKKPFQAEYSAGTPFAQLAEMRVALDEALVRHGLPVETTRPARGTPPRRSIRPAVTPARATATPDSCRDASAEAPDRPRFPAKTAAAPQHGFTSAFAEPHSLPAQPGPTAGAAAKPSFSAAAAEIKSHPIRAAVPASPRAVAPPVTMAAASSNHCDLAEEMQHILMQLSAHLQAERNRGGTAGVTLVWKQARVALSSWEVTAFVEGIGEFSEVIQEGVVTRVLLFQTMEQARKGDASSKLAAVIDMAKGESARLQDALAEAREARNLEATVTLSASSQRLIELLEEAEQVASPSD